MIEMQNNFPGAAGVVEICSQREELFSEIGDRVKGVILDQFLVHYNAYRAKLKRDVNRIVVAEVAITIPKDLTVDAERFQYNIAIQPDFCTLAVRDTKTRKVQGIFTMTSVQSCSYTPDMEYWVLAVRYQYRDR